MSNAFTDLKKILAEKIPKEQERVAAFRKKYGTTKVGDVTVNMIYGGMRGMLGLVWEPSVLDPEEGIKFRGKSILECRKILPKIKHEPLPEGLFWLLITGDVPTEAQVKEISKEWASRCALPDYIVKTLNNFPKSVHPMHQFSAALTILSTDSIFKKEYEAGIHKSKYWDAAYEDIMNLIARLPVLCAMIYRNLYKDGKLGASVNPGGDWSGNFAKMLGYDDPQFAELLRLYLTIHADHEGGNVCAHTTHLVASTLSDPYSAFGCGMSGLAGPLHGLASQEVLLWLKKACAEIGDSPTDDELKDFIWKTLKNGQVIPGYGHAILRKTDPRYICQREYAMKHMPDDKLIKLVAQVYKVVPPILMELGKVANPWPNVDAHSGVLLQYYGMTEMQYYTVLFGISRALGVLASLVWSRALGLPIERPKSISTDKLMELVKAK